MKILGFDSSSDILILGLADGAKILGEESWEAKGKLSEILVESIDKILKRTNVNLPELSGIAISIGPGSFTGLRVGLAVAKALAWGNQIPLIPVSTLEVIAYQAGKNSLLWAIIGQAREGLIQGGVYDYTGELPELQGEYFISQRQKLSEKVPPKANVIWMGEEAHLEEVKRDLPGREILFNNNISVPRGSSVARLGLEKLKRGLSADPRDVEPLYLEKTLYKTSKRAI